LLCQTLLSKDLISITPYKYCYRFPDPETSNHKHRCCPCPNGEILFIRFILDKPIGSDARAGSCTTWKVFSSSPDQKKTTCWFWKLFYMTKNKTNFPNKNLGS